MILFRISTLEYGISYSVGRSGISFHFIHNTNGMLQLFLARRESTARCNEKLLFTKLPMDAKQSQFFNGTGLYDTYVWDIGPFQNQWKGRSIWDNSWKRRWCKNFRSYSISLRNLCSSNVIFFCFRFPLIRNRIRESGIWIGFGNRIRDWENWIKFWEKNHFLFTRMVKSWKIDWEIDDLYDLNNQESA